MITAHVTMTDEDLALLNALKPEQLKRFLVTQGKNMIAQARRNIVKSGGLKGGWPPLSKAYAKRKREGKTPGHGKFKYAMLRDTGELYDSLSADIQAAPNNVSVGLYADGKRNEKLLALHSEGTETLPKRDPVEEMDLFETRFAQDLARFLTGGKIQNAGF